MRRIKLIVPIILCLLVSAESRVDSAIQKAPAGYIRIWHFAPSLKIPLSVSLVGSGAPQPVVLARALQLSDMINYREVPVGQYKLSVRATTKDVAVSETSPEVVSPVQISVAQNSFQTIILQDQGLIPRVLLASDKEPKSPVGTKKLRIFNFAPGYDASLKISPSNEIIAAHIATGMSEHVFRDNPRSVTVVLSNKLKNGHEAEQPVEANFASVDSISAVVMLDRYGRLTFVALEDGRVN
jgi:hypothetical protein